jgi:hypothetical protein
MKDVKVPLVYRRKYNLELIRMPGLGQTLRN